MAGKSFAQTDASRSLTVVYFKKINFCFFVLEVINRIRNDICLSVKQSIMEIRPIYTATFMV